MCWTTGRTMSVIERKTFIFDGNVLCLCGNFAAKMTPNDEQPITVTIVGDTARISQYRIAQEGHIVYIFKRKRHIKTLGTLRFTRSSSRIRRYCITIVAPRMTEVRYT
jgi:hypothetical protein